MARSTNGNLTGKASHGHDDIFDETITSTEQDIRIITKKKKLMSMMYEQEFHDFYVKTPFNSNDLEKALDDKIKELSDDNMD